MVKNKGLSFDDITLQPVDFSMVRSRKDVNPLEVILGIPRLPLISSNMDSVYSVELAKEVVKAGGISVMHRFCKIEDNIRMFTEAEQLHSVWGSVGVGKYELERARSLYNVGCHTLVLDVANAAAIHVVDQYKQLKEALPQAILVVGNFDSANQIKEFIYHAGSVPDFFKVGIGGGSPCSTRIVTGVGTPNVTALVDCVSTGYPIILDGGIKNSGDFCKAIALGATAVMMGRNFAACEESGAKKAYESNNLPLKPDFSDTFMALGKNDELVMGRQPASRIAQYRGSASQSSYETQGKTDYYRAPEGEEYWIPVTGTVKQLMDNYEAALRSSMSYLGAFDLTNYRKNVNWIEVSPSSQFESRPFGKDIK